MDKPVGETKVDNNVAYFNNFRLEFVSEILHYVEMSDRIIFLINWFNLEFDNDDKPISSATKNDRVRHNIFCYSKNDGNLLWQVDKEPPYLNGEPRNSVFVGMGVIVNDGKENEEWYSTNSTSEIIVENFDLENDDLKVRTFQGDQYQLNPLNGKLTWLSYSK